MSSGVAARVGGEVGMKALRQGGKTLNALAAVEEGRRSGDDRVQAREAALVQVIDELPQGSAPRGRPLRRTVDAFWREGGSQTPEDAGRGRKDGRYGTQGPTVSGPADNRWGGGDDSVNTSAAARLRVSARCGVGQGDRATAYRRDQPAASSH